MAAPLQEVIIAAVSQRRCLWDKKHPDYKDTRNVKSNNWKDVAAEVAEATSTLYSGVYLNFFIRL